MSYFGTATSYLCTVKHYKRTENINHYGRNNSIRQQVPDNSGTLKKVRIYGGIRGAGQFVQRVFFYRMGEGGWGLLCRQ